jgi:hypothetical protein
MSAALAFGIIAIPLQWLKDWVKIGDGFDSRDEDLHDLLFRLPDGT